MTLTPREYEVARLFALGRTWGQVARELGIGSDTIQKHRSSAMAKADVGTMAEVWAALGWLRVPDTGASASDATDHLAGSCFGQGFAMTRRPRLKETHA